MAATSPQAPQLADSAYRVVERVRRERWWYAEGIWLDQGPVGASVGFAWTQWLADRGVQAGHDLDEEYAHELYRAAQRVAGMDPTEDTGTTVVSGAEALAERGLVEDYFACPDIDSVVDALLERGPVVAGLQWHDSLGRPTEVDGWTVCKLAPESHFQGGHCILLNGIAMDLQLGGVTGFVRLKNSWGTGWGDGGHALISLDDLKDLLMPDTMLAIPAASVLGPGLHRDVAADGPRYGPPDNVFERSAIDSDAWTRRDTVGLSAYAKAIARAIQHPDTKPPLTIGIKGEWGAGKTSLMRMIQERLEWPEENRSTSKPRPIHLCDEATRIVAPGRGWLRRKGDSLPEMTNLVVLRKAKQATPEDAGIDPGSEASAPTLRAEPPGGGESAPQEDADRWRPTVWFNPWMYQTGEQIWAGLAHEIISQVTDRMDRREKEHFWLQLNLKRIDEEAVRRKIYGLIFTRALPWAILGVTLVVAGLITLAFGAARSLGAVLLASGPLSALLGTGLTATRVLGSRVNVGLSDLVGPVTEVGKVAGESLGNAYDRLIENPDYRGGSGALYLVQADLKRVLDLVATPKQPLVIFIDDLDRCSPGSVVQVIEAVNLFLAGPYTNTIFVIAMEPEMVAAHVEAVYGDLATRLAANRSVPGQDFDLGWRFMEKIVQLPLAVPAMEKERTTVLLESLFARNIDVTEAKVEPEAPHGGEGGPDTVDAGTLSEALALAGDVRPGDANAKAVRDMVERRLTVEDPEVKAAITYAQGFLRRNPREIKRFVNLFRFFTMIYTERRLARMGAPTSLGVVAKLAVLGIRWPGLLSALAQSVGGEGAERTVFELLESPPTGHAATAEERIRKAIEDVGFNEKTTERLLSADLREFLESEPLIGAGVRGYL